MLLTAVGMVLLIACANIAGLQMARASARQRDMAVRVALGASRDDLIRQALLQSMVLTVTGVALGFAVAFAGRAVAAARPAIHAGSQICSLVPRPGAAVCGGGCRVVLAAVRRRARLAPHAAGMVQRVAGSPDAPAPRRVPAQRARSSLVVAQIALCLLLLAGAGLLLSSLEALKRVETGFRSPRPADRQLFACPRAFTTTTKNRLPS